MKLLVAAAAPAAGAPFARLVRQSWLPWATLVLSLGLVLSAWLYVRASERQQVRDRFATEVDLVAERISRRMSAHAQILRGASEFVSLRAAGVTRQEWRRYVEALELDRLNPGVQAMGYAEWIPTDRLEAHVRRLRAEGFPDYAVQPGGSLPPADGGVSAIVFTEPPDERNQRTFSRDMLAEPVRRAAMHRARDTGLVTLSGRLVLYQETATQVQAGTVLFAPVFRRGAPIDTPAQRQEALLGWTYLAFRMQNLLTGIAGDAARLMNLSLHDGEPEQPDALLCELGSGSSTGAGRPASRRRFELAGRLWTLTATPSADFVAGLEGGGHRVILLVGVLASILLLSLSFVLARAERQALTLADERSRSLKLILDSTADAIYGLDTDGRCTFVNRACLGALGYERPEQLLGRNMHQLIHHSLGNGRPLPAERCRIFEAFRTGAPVHVEGEVFWRADGSSFPCEVRSHPQHRGGEVVGAVVSFVDVGERRRNEAEIRRQQALVRSLLDSIPDLIFIKDSAGVYLVCNPAFAAFVGRPREEIVGRTDHDLFPREVADAFRSDDRKTLEQLTPRHLDEWVSYPDGRKVLVDTLKTPHHGPGGELVGILGISRDITAQRAAEEAKESAVADLRAALRTASELNARLSAETARANELAGEALSASVAKSTFLANMSHDIRTPLNSILGFSELLLGDASLAPAELEQVETIYRSGEHVLGLLNDILEISRIEAGRVTLQPSEVDLHTLLADVEAMFQLRLQRKGLAFTVRRSGTLPRWVAVDEQKLRRILTNLIDNAAKFTETGGVSVQVRARPAGEDRIRLAIEVQDTGPGIPAEDLPRLFHQFEQSRAGAGARKGTGLGLAISRGFARLMGGELTVRSELDVGSVFVAEVLAGTTARVGAENSTALLRVVGLPQGLLPPRILVADDLSENRKLLATMLGRVGYEVREAVDGQDAVARFAECRPDLVIMDLTMPGLGGLEAIRRIRGLEKEARTPILVVTASAFEQDRLEARDAGADDFLGKPFRQAELLSKVGQALGVAYRVEDAAGGDEAPHALLPVPAAIPDPLRKAFREAILRADIERLDQLVEQLAPIDPEMASSVRSLAEGFEYERLMELVGGGHEP